MTLTVQLLEADKTVIQQRAFELKCLPGKPSPAHFELLWSQKPLVAGEATHMEVVCKDAYNNLLTSLPGWELWSVFLQQARPCPAPPPAAPMPCARVAFERRSLACRREARWARWTCSRCPTRATASP